MKPHRCGAADTHKLGTALDNSVILNLQNLQWHVQSHLDMTTGLITGKGVLMASLCLYLVWMYPGVTVIVNTCADLLDDGLRPLKAALLVLLRQAGATKLAKALEPGVMD